MSQKEYDVEDKVTLPKHADALCTGNHRVAQNHLQILIELLHYAMIDDPYYRDVMSIDFSSLPPDRNLQIRIRFIMSNAEIEMIGRTNSKHSPLGFAWWLADAHGMTIKEMLLHLLYTAPMALRKHKN